MAPSQEIKEIAPLKEVADVMNWTPDPAFKDPPPQFNVCRWCARLFTSKQSRFRFISSPTQEYPVTEYEGCRDRVYLCTFLGEIEILNNVNKD